MDKCPKCGYMEPLSNVHVHNVMNRYCNSLSGAVAVFNKIEKSFTSEDGQEWIKESVYREQVKAKEVADAKAASELEAKKLVDAAKPTTPIIAPKK